MHLPVVLIFIWIQGRQDFSCKVHSLYRIVYFSCPDCVNFQEVETTPAYPDICFAVDDFDSTFDAVVWCLFVMYLRLLS